MATFAAGETLVNVINFKVFNVGSNQGLVSYVNGVGYIVNNPFYTVPAGRYARIHFTRYQSGTSNIFVGLASTESTTDGNNVWGSRIFAVADSTSPGVFPDKPVVYLYAGEKILRDNGTNEGGFKLVAQIFEFTIP